MALIRPATLDDASALGAMHVQSWREAYAGLLPQALLDGLDPVQRGAGWAKALADQTVRRNWVACEGPRIVGFVSTGPNRDKDVDPARVGEVLGIYVLREAWGSGLGREMLRIALNYLAMLKPDEVALWVLRDNERARRFYEGAGFSADGTTKEEIRHGITTHEVRYRAPLQRLLDRL